MASITVRNVPAETRDEPAARAAASVRSLQEYLPSKLVDLAERPDNTVFVARVREQKRQLGTHGSAERIVGLLDSVTPRDAATLAHHNLADLRVERFPYDVFAERVWELRGNLTPYDAWHVALAEALDAPPATLDGRLASVRGLHCTFMHRPD